MIAMRQLASQRTVQGAAAVALAAMLLATMAAARAIQLDPAPPPLPEPPAAVATPQSAARTPTELIDDAVAASPFMPSRQPGAATRADAPMPVADAETLVLVGTVVGVDGDSFVLVATGNAPAKLLRIGGVFEGYRLHAIGQANAVFTNVQTGERLELRVPRSRSR